jgi:FAD:protein FMN transferase
MKYDRTAMACRFEVIIPDSDADWNQQAALDTLDEIDRIESLLSIYDPHSVVSSINHTASQGWCLVSDEVFELLLRAATAWEQTSGAFDPTVGPLVRLWREWRANRTVPDPAQIEAVRQRVGMQHVSIDVGKRSIRFDRPGVELDLGAIGKGYAVDRAVNVLEGYGLNDFLVHGGTSSAAARGRVDLVHDGWPIGLMGPVPAELPDGTWVLHNQAIGCSGQQNQYYEYGGKRWGHVIDPRTGWPASSACSVALVTSSATQADALSTALLVLGREGTRLVLQACPAAHVFFFSEEGDQP